MGVLSLLMDRIRNEVQLGIQPWFKDHCFAGRPVFPAVESLLFLAEEARRQFPLLTLQAMHNAQFPRFLEIPGETNQIEVIVELEETENSFVRAGLFSRLQTGKFARLVEHGSVCFDAEENRKREEAKIDPPVEQQPFTLSGSRLYEELIPFGPAYRNLLKVDLFPSGAVAKIQTPVYPGQPVEQNLGSPFLLDSALHAACAWGQRFAGFVPFPVGFNSRLIVSPARPGREYLAVVTVVVGRGTELEFDIDLVDDKGEPVEYLRGVRMRDVSGGRMKVPDWMQMDLA